MIVARMRSLCTAAAALASFGLAFAAEAQTSRAAEAVVSGPIDENDLVTVLGNTRPEVAHARDLGRIADATPFPHLALQLKRSPAQEARLQKFLTDVHDPASPEFHHWLTAAEFADRFGLAAHDIGAVEMYLRGHGFTVEGSTANLVMYVSGTAGQIRDAFHTEIHAIEVAGVRHIANMSDPRVPAALAPVLLGPVALNDFRPHPMMVPKRRPLYNDGNGNQAVVPLDLQTIYNFTPIYTAGSTGTGQTVVTVEDTNLYTSNDFATFRRVFSLSSAYPDGSITTVHPSGAAACGNPGVVSGNAGEAALDVEWASAAAPSAAIVLIACADTSSEFGGYIAMSNILNAGTAPYDTYKIFSVSYGESEAQNGASTNSYINNLYALAAGEGASVFTSAGDEGAASSDADQADAVHGITISGFASSPNGVAVGGTDFADEYFNDTSKYWSSTNGKNYHSARSYVPEIPWNSSCASHVIATMAGYSTTYGSSGFCNSTTATDAGYITTASGSGGPSGCATGSPRVDGVKTGSCKGYAKPSWQSGVSGIGSDGVRDIPDISLFAANGALGHYYVFCYSNVGDGGATCTPGQPNTWSGAGGTSFSAPIVAGLQALINQRTGEAQGNPNPVYYGLADTEYNNASTRASCSSDKSGGPASTCIFYDVGLGDMDVPCLPLSGTDYNCYTPSGTYGVLSVQSTSYHPAYPAVAGYDYATGIGTVNAYNLWNSSAWPVGGGAPPR
jgi:subtilase family serine protease